ncbi:MAG: hypothetical protein EOP06_17530 [Proteobacteria bacterium]|nr:MAG: hypothetical protein EOP06_17530 [Pseudomonadota bacterium]
MKFIRALSAFAVLTLALLNAPAWGGGWESSGSPRNSPVMGQPADYLAYTCSITVRHNSEENQYTYTEVLEPKHFKHGYVQFVTPSFGGREFLAGHEISFSGFNPRDQYDGSVSLRLTANLSSNGVSIAKSTAYGHAMMKQGYVTAQVEMTNPQTKEWMQVSASCSPTRK